MKCELIIGYNNIPKVLFLDDGMLRLTQDNSWKDLLLSISGKDKLPEMYCIPYAMHFWQYVELILMKLLIVSQRK